MVTGGKSVQPGRVVNTQTFLNTLDLVRHDFEKIIRVCLAQPVPNLVEQAVNGTKPFTSASVPILQGRNIYFPPQKLLEAGHHDLRSSGPMRRAPNCQSMRITISPIPATRNWIALIIDRMRRIGINNDSLPCPVLPGSACRNPENSPRWKKKGIFLEPGPRVLKERTSPTPQQALMRFSSQPSGDQDERSWMPNEVDGPRTRPEEPGMRITGRCALRDGSASSRSRPTGIRSLEAGRSERNPGPGQVLRFPPGSVTGARRRFDFSRTLHPHTDLSMRDVG